jgi:hypothetical protein
VHYDGAKPQNCIVEKFCTTGGQSLLSLPGIVEKNFSFHFKRYNLTIRAVKCHKKICICSPSSLVQDPTIESAKKWKKNSFGLLELEMADLERFWRKHPLVLKGLIKKLSWNSLFLNPWIYCCKLLKLNLL